MLGRRTLLLLALLGVLLPIAFNAWTFEFDWENADSLAYRFQARLFASGRLAAEAPPDHGFAPSGQFNLLGGRWTSKYPFGHSLALAPGEALGAPWLVPAVATGLFLLVFHRLLRELFGARTAAVGTVVALVSPAVVVIGATLGSESVDRLCLALFLLGLVRTARGGGAAWIGLTGLALGCALNTRPLTALAFALVGTGLAVEEARRSDAPARTLGRLALCAVPLAVMVGLFLGWNRVSTGDALRLSHAADQPWDRLGFGEVGPGYEPEHPLPRFTPAEALWRLGRNTLPCVAHAAMGWGDYRPRGWLATWERSPARFALGVLPLAFVPALALLGLLRSDRKRYGVALAALLAVDLTLYSLYYFDATRWGPTPVHARYHDEALVLGLLPLATRGALGLWDRLGPRVWRKPAALALGAALAVDTAAGYQRFHDVHRAWVPGVVELGRQVRERGLDRAVVFTRGLLETPLGDYPFEDLDRAAVVYYRLGPFPAWRLDESDWRAVYRRHFRGREPYLFTNRERTLARLDAE